MGTWLRVVAIGGLLGGLLVGVDYFYVLVMFEGGKLCLSFVVVRVGSGVNLSSGGSGCSFTVNVELCYTLSGVFSMVV